jgi:hypothetical protein
MATVIMVRALEHAFSCNPGEVFGLTTDEYETEMKRGKPRVEPLVDASPSPSPAEAAPSDPAPADDVSANRIAAPRRARAKATPDVASDATTPFDDKPAAESPVPNA